MARPPVPYKVKVLNAFELVSQVWGAWFKEVDLAITDLEVGAAGVTASYNSDADQTVGISTTTVVNFGSKDFDSHDAVTIGASWKFTAPAPGKYLVSTTVCNGGSESYVDQAQRAVNLYKNGSQHKSIAVVRQQGAVAAKRLGALGGSVLVSLVAGDFIDIRFTNGDVSNTHAVTFNVLFTNETNVSIERVGD